MIGQTISHYKILEKLGEGGMGIVYKAQDLKLNRVVALKFLPSFAGDVERQRFLQEAKAISTLNHHHIATIHDVEEAKGRFFIVFEYIPGGSLKSKIQSLQSEGKLLTLHQALEFALQIAEGLAHAHAHGIIHRDIKSENILLSADGEVKITDFGLAKLFGEVGITKTDSVVGTTAYMSPEQLLGDEVDHRTDIFSFGVVLYEMLAGTRPFRGEHQAAIMYSIVNEDPRPINKFRGDVPPELENILHRTLAKDREDRYPDVASLIRDIQSMKEASEGGQKIGIGARLPMRGIPFSRPVASAILVVILAAAAFLFYELTRHQEESSGGTVIPRKAAAILPFENQTGEKSFDRYRTALQDMLITDLTQSKSIRVLPQGRLYEILKDLNVLEEPAYGSQTLEKIGKYADVDQVVLGSINKGGERIRLDFKVLDASTGEIIGGDRVEGAGEKEILSMVDEMRSKVQQVLRVSEPPETSAPKGIADITSTSLQANILYQEGVNNFYKGNYLNAIEFFKKAVDEDSTFALAFARLAESYSSLGYDLKAQGYAERALRYSERVSLNDRYRIEASYAKIHYDYDRAVDIYKKLVSIFPDDPRPYFDLSAIFEMNERTDSAIVSVQKVVALEKTNGAAYVRLAKLHSGKGETNLASQALDTALQIYSALGSQEGRAAALIVLGDIRNRRGEYKEARSTFEEALEIRRQLGDKAGIARALQNIGTTYHFQGDLLESLNYYNKALPIVGELGNKLSEGSLLNNIGTVFLQQGKYARALEFHEPAYRIAKEIHNKRLLAESGYGIGLDYKYLGKAQKSNLYITDAHMLFREIGDKKKLATSAIPIGDNLLNDGKFDNALHLYLESLDAGRAIEDRGLIALSCGRVGSIHTLQGRYTEALKVYQEGYENAQASRANSGMAFALRALGFNFFSVGKIDTAEALYRQALGLTQKIGSKSLLAQLGLDMGELWQVSGQLDSAVLSYKRSLDLSREMKSPSGEADAKSRLGTCYVQQNGLKEGLALGRGAAEEARKTKSEDLNAVVSYRLAFCYMVARKYRLAQEEAQKAIEVSRRLGMRENLWKSYSTMAQALYAQNKHAEALQNLRLAIETLDEIDRDLGKGLQLTFRGRMDIQKAVREMIALFQDMNQTGDAKRLKEKYRT